MKKVLIPIISLIFIMSVHASSKFNVNIKKILSSSKTDELKNSLNMTYQISYEEKKDKNEEVLEKKSRMFTYLLLGDGDISDESPEDYIKRRGDYLSYMYNPEIPKKSDEYDGYDHSSQEWKDSAVAGVSLPSLFNGVNILRPKYKVIDNIKIVKIDRKGLEGYFARVVVPNVKLEVADEKEPRKIVNETTTMVLYYFFKEYKNDFYIYYVFGQYGDDLDEYVTKNKTDELNGSQSIKVPENSDISKMYNQDNIKKINSKAIVDSNKNKVMILNAVYNGATIDYASGVMLTNNVLVSSYSFLQNALLKAQFVNIADQNGNSYKLEGIISINPEADIALYKISGYTGTGVTLGKTSEVKVEDAIVQIGSKSGVGLTSSVSIAITVDSDIQTLIPITSGDLGGPIFNKNGELVGIVNSKSVESSTSFATGTDCLKDIQSKIAQDQNIKVTSFDKLKENYYAKDNEEIVKNNLSDSKWNEFKKIGSLEETIFIPLVKASYKNKTLSLRYKNDVSSLMSNNQFATMYANNLKKDNYKEVLNSTNKKIYENNKYKIVIMNEFNYLIIVMVTK